MIVADNSYLKVDSSTHNFEQSSRYPSSVDFDRPKNLRNSILISDHCEQIFFHRLLFDDIRSLIELSPEVLFE